MIGGAHPTLRFGDLFRGRSSGLHALLKRPGLHATYNGRAALYQLFRAIREVRDGTVLIPAFHCPTVVDPVLRAGFDVGFYGIRADLSIDAADLRARAREGTAAVIAIHYLGFPANLAMPLAIRAERRCLLVEDCAHSFLRAAPVDLAGDGGDATVYSYYKLAPTYAGGAFQIRSPEISWNGPLGAVPPPHAAVIAKRLIEQAIGNSRSAALRGAFERIERARLGLKRRRDAGADGRAPGEAAPPERDPYEFDADLANRGMPWLSRRILRACRPDAIVAARRLHYAAWDAALVETPRLRKLFRALPEDVCPWAYPVVLDDRSAHDHVLRARGVPLFTFGERLHPLFHERAAGAFPEAEALSRNLLLLAVHQNLDVDQIRRHGETVNDHFRSLG